ncbi:MAG: helix-turn-helix domain-containing protein [Myxococcaceae bacterium]|nr:helix-turn-helix domain-containing protein [Myxococcaceae bacterium]MCI0672922.1 helix-turn-helix domain-containing protein [Myxococcaceae bacterium]
MTRSAKHSVLGSYLDDHITEQREKDLDFAAEFDRLSLARLVREARKSAHLSQEQLAVRAGLRQPHVARIESGKVTPKLPMLQRISEALGATMEVRFLFPSAARAKAKRTTSTALTISAYRPRQLGSKGATAAGQRRKAVSKGGVARRISRTKRTSGRM